MLCYIQSPDFKGSSCEKRHREYGIYTTLVPFWCKGFFGGNKMETRLASIAIVVEEPDSVERLNGILHEYGEYVIGRMGVPHKERGVNLISIAIDAPQDIISSLSGKLGMLKGVTAKAVYSKA